MLNVFGAKKKPNGSKLRAMLPATHAFVTFVVRGTGVEGRLCFEGASLKTFRTTKIAGMVPGQNGVFTYDNQSGTFMFTSRLVSVSDDQAVFNLPDEVKTVSRAPALDRRAEPRIDTTVSAEWRFKPVGKIVGAWSKVIVSDLSRVSANMTSDRALKVHDVIEVRMAFDPAHPVTIDAAIVRSENVRGRYTIGLAFRHVNEEDSHIITRFVNKRMTELRARGLV